MKILVEIRVTENWKQDHFDIVKAILESDEILDVVSVEVA